MFGMLALAASTPAVCQGWMPTPEARMACCTGDGPCPMHTSEDSDKPGAMRVIDQAEADRCCAASEHDESAPATAPFALAVVFALVASPVPAQPPDVTSAAQVWRTLVPIPRTSVPKHLLLSVLLV